MGAWGPGAFENDDALDWVHELEATDDLASVREALVAVVDSTNYLDASICAVAIAAAEVVAALRKRPLDDLPEEAVVAVAGRRGQFPGDLSRLAIQAVDVIMGDSELKDLWSESEDAEAWEAGVLDLRIRLGG